MSRMGSKDELSGRQSASTPRSLPEGWERLTIAALLKSGGSIKTGPFGTVLKAAEYSIEGVPVISVGEIGPGVLTIRKETPRVSPEILKRLPEYRLNDGDIVFGRKGAVDRSALIAPTQDGWFLGSDGIRLRLPKSVLPGYAIHQLQMQEAKNWLLSNSVGTTMASLNGEVLGRVSILIAPELEQQEIAEALSDVDALISGLNKLIATKRAIMQGMIHRLLTPITRLPGFSREWETKRIREFTDCTAGGTPNTSVSKYWGGNHRWMNSGELHLKVVTEVLGRVTDLGLRRSSAKMLPENCVLIGLAGQGRTRGTVAINRVPLATNQSIAAVFPNESFCSDYLYFNLGSRYDELRGMSAGDGGRGGLNLTIIRSIPVPLPELDEQRAIAAVLRSIDDEIVALERRRQKIEGIKQGMMQQLLTGRIRLMQPEVLA